MTSTKTLMTALVLFLSALNVPAFAQQGATMSTWTVDAGRFSVALPARPTHEAKQVQLEGGERVTAHDYAVETGNGRYSYLVTYADLPATIRIDLDGTAAGWRRDATVERSRAFLFGGRPARYEVLRSSDGHEIHACAIVDGHRLYQLVFVATNGSGVPAEADAFLRSFTITQEGR